MRNEEHAIRAFDLDAVDYLVKPVDIDRFDRAMRRLLETLGAPSRARDAGAGQRLGGGELLAGRHQAGHLVLGQ